MRIALVLLALAGGDLFPGCPGGCQSAPRNTYRVCVGMVCEETTAADFAKADAALTLDGGR